MVLHGGSVEARRDAALLLARALLCERTEPRDRPCGSCRHCRRVAWPGDDAPFHPDFAVLVRDLKTVTSAEATRTFLEAAHVAPFEARGQVFVVAEADSFSAEAGDALLKLLEEPGLGSPRSFVLLAPSRLDLPVTLRSRSWSVYLGTTSGLGEEKIAEAARGLAATLARGPGAIRLLDAAARLGGVEKFDDPRAEAPWIAAAAIVHRAALEGELPDGMRRPMFALAEALLGAPALRLRGVPAERILEGLVSRHLAR